MPEAAQEKKPSLRVLSMKRVTIRQLIPDEETAIRALGYFYFDYPEECKSCTNEEGGGKLLREPGSRMFKCLRCDRQYLITNMAHHNWNNLSCGMERTRLPLHLWFHCWYYHCQKAYGYKRLMKELHLTNRKTVRRMCNLIRDDTYKGVVSWHIQIERWRSST